jgi:triosephosphate isomerase
LLNLIDFEQRQGFDMSDTFAVLVNLSPYYALEEGMAWYEALQGRAEHDGLLFYLALPIDLLEAISSQPAPPFLILGSKAMLPVNSPTFTETIAGGLVKSFGGKFVLLGTELTRKLEGETHAVIREKIRVAKAEGLIPILCIGETGEELQEGKSAEVLTRQIGEATEGLDTAALSGLQIVYEAPWIAAAVTRPTDQEIDKAYHFCRDLVHSLLGEPLASSVKVYCPVPADLKEAEAFIHTLHADGFYFCDPHQLTAIDEAALRAKAATARKAREAEATIETAAAVVEEKKKEALGEETEEVIEEKPDEEEEEEEDEEEEEFEIEESEEKKE